MICKASTRCFPSRRSSRAAALAAKSAYGKKVCIELIVPQDRHDHPRGGGAKPMRRCQQRPPGVVGVAGSRQGSGVAAERDGGGAGGGPPCVGQGGLVTRLVRPDGRDQRVGAVDLE